MTAHDLERWKAHFRYVAEIHEDNPEAEWIPLSRRERTIEDIMAEAARTAQTLDRVGRR